MEDFAEIERRYINLCYPLVRIRQEEGEETGKGVPAASHQRPTGGRINTEKLRKPATPEKNMGPSAFQVSKIHDSYKKNGGLI